MSHRVLTACAAVALALAATVAYGAKPTDKDVQKAIKTVVTSIRYSKDDVAASQLAWEPMSKAFLGAHWSKFSADEQKELMAGVQTLIRKLSFQKGREMFEYLDAVLYAPLKLDGDKAIVRTTVVVNRNYKKTEIVIDFVLVGDGGAWKIMDTIMAGESTTASFFEDQVDPIFQEGGTAGVMKALRDKLAEVK